MGGKVAIKNISRLVTMAAGKEREGKLGVIKNGAIRIRGGRIVWVGTSDKLPRIHSFEKMIDANGCVVMPGLCDCHTHLVHAGFREHEFNSRSTGLTYQRIARLGGGIMATVRATRKTNFAALLESARARADEALSLGTTSIEIKTGYGLDTKTELKMAKVIRVLGQSHPLRIFGTFLGAHVVPPEFKKKRGKYIELIIHEMLPRIAATGACQAADVFVEDGAFTKNEAKKIAQAAKAHGLFMHLHVDQFSSSGGGELAAEIGAFSADHLDHTTSTGMRAMRKGSIVPVILPGASFLSNRGRFPDAKKMLENKLPVAIATDYNPGTNPSLNLFQMATIAIAQMGLSCDDALLGVTRNAALALGVEDRGSLGVGNLADIIILDAPNEYFPLYRYGVNFVSKVIINGRVVFERGV